MDVLPAPSTKHVATLHTRLPNGAEVTVRQQAVDVDGTRLGTTGTTLWLGAQVLSAYLASAIEFKPQRGRALELGAGVGYLALTAASLGYDVVTSDIEPVVSCVLAPNAAAAPRGCGRIEAREIDWFDAVRAAERRSGGDEGELEGSTSLALLDAQYDLVLTTDTIYAPEMTPALWAALERAAAPRPGRRTPTVYIGLERRDPRVVDAALEMGRQRGCTMRRVAHGRVVKALERAGWHWAPEDWEGIEVWKGKWR
ncbi:hypothetical protein CspeluHIS016_0107930 [Cutaneotrichosporon spelunceum]|uniref:S-adenosyl-L-methionine-dependent methyltransferase n=1 Tax=Cutaneotrichosporon spelunceum TaxID=1672016 RepID=A0AAD3TPN3_9TREE|nr:hypothetical protein CspeluHIS016_0107930 [Cutaneotrichosporon spelunceum]